MSRQAYEDALIRGANTPRERIVEKWLTFPERYGRKRGERVLNFFVQEANAARVLLAMFCECGALGRTHDNCPLD